MNGSGAQALIAVGILTAIAAIAHLACIVIGAPAYRFMGAGERMARAVEAGKVKPVLAFFMGDMNDAYHPQRILGRAGFTSCFAALGMQSPPTYAEGLAPSDHWPVQAIYQLGS